MSGVRGKGAAPVFTRAQLSTGLIALALAVLSWGPMFPLAKRALVHVDAYFLGSMRYTGALLLFLVCLAWSEGRRAFSFDGHVIKLATFGIAGIVGYNILVWVGLTHTRAEHAAILMAMQTPLTALVYWIWKGQRPANFTLACIAVALIGVALVVTQGKLAGAFAEGSLWGDALVLTGAACWIVYTAGQQFVPTWSPLRYTAMTAIPGCIGLWVVVFIAWQLGLAHAPTAEKLWLIAPQLFFFTVFSTFLGVLCFNVGVKNIGPLNAMLVLNIVPVTTFAIEAALGRKFSAIEIFGAALVIAALVVNNLYLRRVTR